jgi:diguanylate cyclase (GGDEF)-like protein
VTGLLTLESRVFSLPSGLDYRSFTIERFPVNLPYLNHLSGTGFWIRDITFAKQREQHLLDLVERDSLTNAFSRRYFFSLFEDMKKEYIGETMALLMLDIDFFKRINDLYGHALGDEVLRIIPQRILGCLRPQDILCRYGGEEFAILLRNAGEEDARDVASRILTAISSNDIHLIADSDQRLKVTVSIGGHVFDLNGETELRNIIQAADEKLYAAKSNYRNQAVF